MVDALETGNLAYTALMTLARACGLSPRGIYLILICAQEVFDTVAMNMVEPRAPYLRFLTTRKTSSCFPYRFGIKFQLLNH